MGELISNNEGKLVSFINDKGGNLAIPKPFERDIFLFETYVAGTIHVEGIKELEQYMNIDDKFDFFHKVLV